LKYDALPCLARDLPSISLHYSQLCLVIYKSDNLTLDAPDASHPRSRKDRSRLPINTAAGHGLSPARKCCTVTYAPFAMNAFIRATTSLGTFGRRSLPSSAGGLGDGYLPVMFALVPHVYEWAGYIAECQRASGARSKVAEIVLAFIQSRGHRLDGNPSFRTVVRAGDKGTV
jgi:hypothetical protein